jgi:hypothetical protein
MTLFLTKMVKEVKISGGQSPGNDGDRFRTLSGNPNERIPTIPPFETAGHG